MSLKNLQASVNLIALIIQSNDLLDQELSAALHDVVTDDAYNSIKRLRDYSSAISAILDDMTSDVTEVESAVYCESAADNVQQLGMRPLPCKVKIQENERG
jgi:hypothetical protein